MPKHFQLKAPTIKIRLRELFTFQTLLFTKYSSLSFLKILRLCGGVL